MTAKRTPKHARPRWPFFAQEKFLHEQICLMESQLGKPLFLSWITAAALSWVFARLEALPLWLVWFAGYSVMLWIIAWGLRTFRGDPNQVRRRAWSMLIAMAAVGGFWGSSSVLVTLAQGDLPTLFMVTAMAEGTAAGALGVCGVCWPVFAAYLLMVVLVGDVGFLLYGGDLLNTLVIFSFLFLVFLLKFSRTLEASALRSIELRFENKDLVQRLQGQSQQAHEAREQADQARAQAEAARALAETHSQDKSRFLAAASHDLRQPIHALGLFLEALGVTPLDDKQRAIFDSAMLACEASRNMLGTLLDFSRLDAGVVRFAPRNFSVQAMLLELSREYAPQAEDKGMVFRLHDTPWAAYSDPALVSLIVRNLIANAVRYTHNGGILVGCRRRGSQLVIEVWDTGIGIEEGDHQRIFKEFLQLDNPERDRTKGLGLGLAIVQGLCRIIGTLVQLHSRVGRGSVFRLTLPLADAAVIDTQGVKSQQLPSVQGLRVLVVDDEQAVRESMQQLLHTWGCQCAVAVSLQDALALEWPEPVQVVVTDYRLQNGVTGKDVIQALRQRWGEQLHCVIVTGDTAPDRLRDAHDTGAVLLHKPLAAHPLLRALVQGGGT